MNPEDRRVPAESSHRACIEHAPDIERFSPVLRQALMAVEPAFFGWDARQQDRYRRAMPGDACERLDQRLGNATACTDPDDAQQDNRINTLKLPLFGIGQDCFYLNEPGSGWYDMETVADLSREHFESDPEREENKLPFMGQFYPTWCRYLRRDRLVYATLISFHHHLLDAIGKRHDTLVERLIPHRYVAGRDHGKKTKGGYLWDTKRDAKGLEGQLDELITRAWNIQNVLYLRALDDCHARGSGQVFRVVTSDGVDPMTSWVFDGLKAMQDVRLTHFLADIHAHRACRRTLSGLLRPYLEEAEGRLHHEYEDIMRNWDPRLATLKRRRKVVLSEHAASDLLGEGID
jgi:hypothetical protein